MQIDSILNSYLPANAARRLHHSGVLTLCILHTISDLQLTGPAEGINARKYGEVRVREKLLVSNIIVVGCYNACHVSLCAINM